MRVGHYLALVLLAAGLTGICRAQLSVMPARANVVAYDDVAAIEKLAYRESPYFMELSGSWHQRRTDTSLIYSRTLAADKVWRDYRVYLNVRCGRGVRVLINNKLVGVGDDSRHWNEFLLNDFLKFGKENTLAIEALGHSEGGLLEDQSLATGLNGEPYLLFKTDPNVEDFTLQADYDAVTGSGTLNVEAWLYNSARKGKYYVEVELWDPRGRSFDRMGRWVVFDNKSDASVEMSRTWIDIEAWSAEHPALYTAVIRLRDEDMAEEEVVGARFGFRSVTVSEGQLLINGKAVTLKGVTYGVEHVEGAIGRQQLQRDVVNMKRNNVNAVRTSRYSPMDEYFYELCDQYGLYVVCDANLLPLSTRNRAVATEPAYVPAFERRVENLYGSLKNHSSIICWSLGNSKDKGSCMSAAYKRLKTIDKSRPVIFAGADYTDATDLTALVMPSVYDLQQASARRDGRPVVMLSSVNADNYEQLDDLWDISENSHTVQGGFVGQWPLNKVQTSELKHLYRPFDVRLATLGPDEGEFVIENHNSYVSFGEYSLEYTIYSNKVKNIVGGDLTVAVRAGESARERLRIPPMDLQAGDELFIRFDLNQRHSAMQPWQTPNTRSLGSVVFPLPQKSAAKLAYKTDTVARTPFDAPGFDKLTFADGHNWHVEIVDTSFRQIDEQIFCADAMLRYVSASGSAMCDVRETHTRLAPGNILFDYTFMPSQSLRGDFQPEITISTTFTPTDTLQWFGLDREVCFGNGGNSGIVGVYSQPAAPGFGERQEVRWMVLSSGQHRILAHMPDTTFSVRIDSLGVHILPYVNNDHGRTARLHLLQLTPEDEVSSYLAIEYPQTASVLTEPPVIEASSTRFSEPISVSIKSNKEGLIYYTLDGSDPTPASLRYSGPITLTTTTTVKARVYPREGTPSFTSTRKFNFDYITSTTFSRKPNTPYNRGTDTLLFDGETGEADNLAHGWLGFSGDGVTTVVDLSKPLNVEAVTVRFAHAPDTWSFAPKQLTLTFSRDGKHYADTLVYPMPFDPAAETESETRVVELHIPVGKADVQSIRIEAGSIGRIPVWHRAKGLKPWMMMDEIKVEEKLNDKPENE